MDQFDVHVLVAQAIRGWMKSEDYTFIDDGDLWLLSNHVVEVLRDQTNLDIKVFLGIHQGSLTEFGQPPIVSK